MKRKISSWSFNKKVSMLCLGMSIVGLVGIIVVQRI